MEFVYRGLKGTLEHVEVTEKELDARLMQLQQQHPCVKTVTDRAAKAGDELVLDYAGYADGVQFPGGTAENQTLTLGSGAFIPGFDRVSQVNKGNCFSRLNLCFQFVNEIGRASCRERV